MYLELCLPNVPTTTLQEILDSTQMDLSTSVKQATTSTSTESSSGFSYATNTMLTEVTASSPVTIATDITPFSNQPVTPTDCSLTGTYNYLGILT